MPPRNAADCALVERALAGQREALDAFIERMRCVPRFLAAQNRKLGRPLDDQELEDLVQDVLAALWRKLARYDGTASLETWTYRFCYFELIGAVRAQGRRHSTLPEEHGEMLEPESPPAPDLEEAQRAMAALESLPAEEAAILRLKHLEGLTFEAIGKALGMSPNTAKTRYYRGIAKLRDRLRQRTPRRDSRREP